MDVKVIARSVLSSRRSLKKSRPGASQVGLMLMFQNLQVVSSRLASLLAYYLWFHPGRQSVQKTQGVYPQGRQSFQLKIKNKTVHYWCAGSGPGVLLVHGWGSSGKQMAKLGQALFEKGFKVIWFDAPAHGESSGWRTDLFEVSETILKIQQQQGEFKALLAHSFGVPCSLYAVGSGLVVNKIVAIATPATAIGLIEKFCKIIKANNSTYDWLVKRIERFLGETTMDQISAQSMALNIDQQCLVIHDKHDRMISYKEGVAVHGNLRHSTFIETQHLGHNKVLYDPKVISHCEQFISQ